MRASRLLSRKAIGLHQVKFSQPQPCLLSGRISCIRDGVNCPQQSPWKIRVSRLVCCISADSAYLQKKTRVSKVKLSFPSRLLHCVTFASTCTAQRPPPLHKVLEQLECPGTPADLTIYASLVQQCGNAKALSHGRLLHSYIITSTSHGESTYLMSLLVQMYGQCAALKDACIVFSHIQERNIYSWNIMIGTNVKHEEWLEATRLFQQMQVEGVIPDKYSIVSTLSAYAGLETLPQGKALHSRFACTELEKDVVVGTALINLYGHCGSTECAELMFAKLQERDLVLCNAMITVHAQQGHGNEALQLFNHMHQEGFIPNKVTFLGILDSCAGYTGLAVGKRLHIHIRHAGLESDVFVVPTLISMYGKCGSLERAEVLFDELSERNVVSWNAIIAVHAHQEHGEDVLQLLNQMQQEALIPDKVTFRTILCSFAGQTSIVRGKLVHTCATCCGFDSDIVVGTALFSMYGRCGSLESARKLFDGMFKRDLVAWNAMIALYAQNGHDKEALQLLRQMQQAGVVPDKVTLISSLTACAGASLEAAQRLFDKIHERNVVVWNAMLGACVQHGHSKQAFQLFEQMLGEKVTPDKVTFLTMLSACASRAAVMEGKWVHTLIICSQFESHGPLVSGLVHMYNKCGGLEEACAVFQHMHERDAILFNAMITAYTEHGHGKEVLQFWVQMQQEAVIPDEVTFIGILDACATEGTLVKGKCIHACITESKYGSEIIVATSLFNMYHKCSSLEEAHSVFGSMVQHDVVSWTAIITANTEKNQSKVVLQLFHQMQTEGVLADNGIYVNVLAACADEAALMEGKMIHTQIIHNDLGPDVSLGNALVNMYGKCGSMEDAQREFHKMPGQDVLSFNIMIAGCAQHGHGKKALQLYDQMQQQGTVPNEYTFGSVLSACSHAGLVEEGHKCLIMIEDHGSTPVIEHYDCMVDLLGRTGRLEEAEGLLDEMPMQPTPVSWMTLLAASRIQMDIGRGERVSQHLFELDFGDASPYVALANLYAVAGRRENSEGVISWKEVGGYSSRLISGIDTLVPHVTAADHASITLLSLQ